MPEIRGVFFDLYGTLLCYGDMEAAGESWYHAIRRELIDNGHAFDEGTLVRLCEEFLLQPEPPVQDDGLTVYERRMRVLVGELSLELEVEELRLLSEASIAAWHAYTQLDPEAKSVLGELQGRYKLALISNFDHPPHVHQLLDELALRPFFDAVVVSGDVGVKKPDPAIFAPALEQTGLATDEALFIGDSPEDDIAGARAARLRPVLIRRLLGADGSPPAWTKDGVRVVTGLREVIGLVG
ncbi:MAG: HAD family hydrolase [Gemmatimonadota bacterium]|nr:HAD family hydrolase [Gemmatimonadota bacterium]